MKCSNSDGKVFTKYTKNLLQLHKHSKFFLPTDWILAFCMIFLNALRSVFFPCFFCFFFCFFFYSVLSFVLSLPLRFFSVHFLSKSSAMSLSSVPIPVTQAVIEPRFIFASCPALWRCFGSDDVCWDHTVLRDFETQISLSFVFRTHLLWFYAKPNTADLFKKKK